jgi:two-component system sensor histidine kinase BarA
MNNDIQLIHKNGNHLLHLINDVLDMAKIEAGRMNLSPTQFKVHDIFEDVFNISSPQANDKGISLIIEDESDQQVEIIADRTRISQVLLNVVNNAIKFTDLGSVNLSVRREGENALIAIRDTGDGIPADKLESIFQEFTQVDSSSTRKVGGTGLGLPISRRLIEMHGGRLWAESTGIGAGQGSVFFVELPLESKITESIEAHER